MVQLLPLQGHPTAESHYNALLARDDEAQATAFRGGTNTGSAELLMQLHRFKNESWAYTTILAAGRMNYAAAIEAGVANPNEQWSFPLLQGALHRAETIHAPAGDVAAVFPALRQVMNQPYAMRLLEDICRWAPEAVLANADSFAARPFAVPIITQALTHALDRAEQSPVMPAEELHQACLLSLHMLPQATLKTALSHEDFAKALFRYKQRYEQDFAITPATADMQFEFSALKHAFTTAEYTLKHPAPAPEGPPIIVFGAPSAAGKTTQRNLLLAENPRREFLVSYTTRAPRAGEVDGIDYHFLRIGRTEEEAKAEFERLKQKGDVFFETTDMYGNCYGTPRTQLEEGLAAGKQLIADVNIEGLQAFRKAYPSQVRGIFLQPNVNVLEDRLRIRIKEAGALSPTQRAELEADATQRLAAVPDIIKQAGFYDYTIHQEACTPSQTFGLVQKAIAAPSNEIGKFELHHLGFVRSMTNSNQLPYLVR